MTSTRRSDFDVTNSVQVSSPAAVLAAVEALYRPVLGFRSWVPVASEIIHFTGYEVPFARIEETVSDARDITVGHLLGTADMIAQMADRCYLEKCRDRLYAEFVLGGVALPFSR